MGHMPKGWGCWHVKMSQVLGPRATLVKKLLTEGFIRIFLESSKSQAKWQRRSPLSQNAPHPKKTRCLHRIPTIHAGLKS